MEFLFFFFFFLMEFWKKYMKDSVFKEDNLQFNCKATFNCLKYKALKSIIQVEIKLNVKVFDKDSHG